MAELETHIEQLIAIAELLMGAAHADGEVLWAERSAMGKVLADFVGVGDLPEVVATRIQNFDPKTFDLAAACGRLQLDQPRDRRDLLQLIAQVTDADAVLEAGEDAYLRRVAAIIGADESEFRALLEDD